MGRLKKAEYIERYGEEAWLVEQKRRRKYDKLHCDLQRKKERNKEYNYKYWQEHKDELNLKHRERYQKLKDEHPEKIKEINKDSYWKHVDRHRAHNKYYRNTKEGRASSLLAKYKKRDEKKETGCALTRDWIVDHIFNSSCIYCGDNNWKHLGADKVDNNFPHSPDNCICACGICNVEREHMSMSVEEFIEYRKTHPRVLKEEPFQTIKEVETESGKKIKVLRKNP